jgi:hypothetical protein
MSDESSGVSAVAIIFLVLIAIGAFYLLFLRGGVSANRSIDINVNTPKNTIQLPIAR